MSVVLSSSSTRSGNLVWMSLPNVSLAGVSPDALWDVERYARRIPLSISFLHFQLPWRLSSGICETVLFSRLILGNLVIHVCAWFHMLLGKFRTVFTVFWKPKLNPKLVLPPAIICPEVFSLHTFSLFNLSACCLLVVFRQFSQSINNSIDRFLRALSSVSKLVSFSKPHFSMAWNTCLGRLFSGEISENPLSGCSDTTQ